MAISITKQLYVAGKHANIDATYGPYDTIQHAIQSIPEEIREVGLTVIIKDANGEGIEYWWKRGIEDADLTLKIDEAAYTKTSQLENDAQFVKRPDLDVDLDTKTDKTTTNILTDRILSFEQQQMNGVVIKKTYNTLALITADTSPTYIVDGIQYPFRAGELAAVINDEPNNGIYRYKGTGLGWEKVSGLNFEVVQTTGTDVNRPMSQKAVTDELNKKANSGGSVSTLQEIEERISQIITTPAESVSAQEIIDARMGKISLGDKIRELSDGIFTNNYFNTI